MGRGAASAETSAEKRCVLLTSAVERLCIAIQTREGVSAAAGQPGGRELCAGELHASDELVCIPCSIP